VDDARTLPRPWARRTTLLAVAGLVLALLVLRPLPALAAEYDPLDVICYETYRASSSMSADAIQAFLETLSGPLKDVVAKDHNGVRKPASQIIWDAAQAWNLNPRVILATLQKEQSLLTISNSSDSARLYKAMGCGVYGDADNDGKTDNRFPGFGNQVWNGARVLSTYEVTYNWTPGATRVVTAYKTVTATKTVDGEVVSYDKRVSYKKTITPKNASTFALYIYTPYYPQKLVWDVYVRYFGDPQTPPRMRPVYRFRSTSNGTYYYTRSETKRYQLLRNSSKSWTYNGVAFTVDASATTNVTPLMRLYNTATRRYGYTTSLEKRAELLARRPSVWRSDGTVALISVESSGAAPVYALRNKTTLATLYTANLSTKTRLTSGKGAAFTYRGVPFYVGASEPTTPPVGPVTLP